MKYFLPLVVVLALTGCTTVNKTNTVIKNASESAQLDKVCKLRAVAIAGFELVKSQVTISDNVTAKVYATSAAIKRICDDKPSNIGEALVTATRLYSELLSTQAEVSRGVATVLVTNGG